MQAAALATVLVAIVIGVVLLTASGTWWLTPLASNWYSLDTLLLITTVATGIAFAAVKLFLAYTVYRHRSGEGRRAFFFADNPRLEWSLIGVTTFGIVLLLVPGLVFYAQVITPPEDPLVIEVLAEQWQWHYRYPGEDGTFGRASIEFVSPANRFGIDIDDPASQDDVLVFAGPLYLPVDRPVLLRLRSNDVIHSFFVPEFRVKMDVVPGMVTQMWFTPTRTGEFQAVCTELCGIGHFRMIGSVVVLEPAEFEQRLAGRPTVAAILGGGR